MSQNNGLQKLKAALLFSIIVDLLYGVAFFVAPGTMSQMAGGTLVEHGWLRWSGGVLLGMAAGAFQAYRDPAKQKAMITALILAPLLSGLALACTLLETHSVHTWFILLPCVVLFAMFAVMLWARQGAKEILE